MLLQITNEGIKRATNVGTNGPKINITTFKVGSGYNYTPVPEDTGLKGSILYTGQPSNYSIDKQNQVHYTLLLDQTVGTWNFGEIGLYLEDGTLFALGALPTLQPKYATSETVEGNVVSIDAVLSLQNIAGVIDYNITPLNEAKLLYIDTVALLLPPVTSPTNAYLTGDFDDLGKMIYCLRSSDYKWEFPTYSGLMQGTVDAGSTGTSMNSYDLGNAFVDNFTRGRYILQFTSGPLAGEARLITRGEINKVYWNETFDGNPLAGDTWEIYTSNSFYMTQFANSGVVIPVYCASSTPITLSGTQVIDGITPPVGSRVLVYGQSNAAENGIYIVVPGTWGRATDYNSIDNITPGSTVNVINGNRDAGAVMQLTNTSIEAIDVTPLNYDYANRKYIRRVAQEEALIHSIIFGG